MKIVVDDVSILRQLCGVDDSNIKYIEQLFDEQIYCRGNAIEIPATFPDEKKDVLEKLLQVAVLMIQKGFQVDTYQIKMLFDELWNKSGESVTDVIDMMRNRLDNRYAITVSGKTLLPKSDNQRHYMNSMASNQIVFGIGPAGTGKTFLAIAKALEALQSGDVHKIVLTRPVVEAGESLGFLPGDLTQKIAPYLHPLYDAMGVLVPLHTIRKMEENGSIEIAPLAYMRGRSLQNAFIILDEAQNTTKEQMKMFLTRIGFGAKAVITGDITQIDIPQKKKSGLLHASTLLQGIEGIERVFFNSSDVVRSRLVRKIVDAYEKEKE